MLGRAVRLRWEHLPQGRSLPEDSWRRRHQVILRVLWLHAFGLVAFALAKLAGLAHSLFEGAGVISFAALFAKPLPAAVLGEMLSGGQRAAA